MLEKFLLFILKIVLFVGTPAVVFFVAYAQTDRFFQLRRIPYPFEIFGILVGTALALWTLALIEILRGISKKFMLFKRTRRIGL